MDPLTRSFARNVRALRIAQRITQASLGKRAGITTSYLSMLERGVRTPPLPTITALARALKVKPLYLLQELDLPEPPIDMRYAVGPARRRR